MTFNPSVSIIIAVKNARDHLQQTLQSLRDQQYHPLEVIVVDGASTDGTLDVIHANADLIHRLISEPDQGISDAFNKGLRLATGDYINFQGAGDTLVSPNCIQQLFSELDPSYQLICGKVIRVQEDGQTPIWVAPSKLDFKPKKLLFKMALPHQGLFTHRTFFERLGEFDLSVRFAMDYDLLLRAYHDFPKTKVKDVLISRWRAGGIGKNRIPEILSEYYQLKLKHRIAPAYLLKIIYYWDHFKYQLKTRYLSRAY